MLTPVPPTECARAREAASARLDGELSEHEVAQLEVHLATCAGCANYAASIAATTAELRAAELVQPAETVFVPRRAARRLRLVPAVAAAAVVAGVAASSFALGGALGSHRSQGRPAATTTSAPQVAQLPLVQPGQQPAVIRITSKIIAV